MGRYSTGAWSTGESLRININQIKGLNRTTDGIGTGKITWTNGANIGITLEIKDGCRTLTLNYTHTDREGNKKAISQRVNIEGLPSNLGRGENFYFLCPVSFKRCKIIYMAYGSQYFKCRKAYRNRIYYKTQMRSKLDRYNSRYWDLDALLSYLKGRQKKSHYKGNSTRLNTRIKKLTEQMNYMDEMRWSVLPKSIIKMMTRTGVRDARELY